MKKWILAAVGAALIFFYGEIKPFESMDAGELCVVETLFVEENGETISLCAKDAEGQGGSFEDALNSMRQNAPGKLFLRQTKRIVLCGGAEDALNLVELPREIPLGAAVYRTGKRSKTLLKELELLEKRLEIQEQEEGSVPTLGQLKNELLKQGAWSGEN